MYTTSIQESFLAKDAAKKLFRQFISLPHDSNDPQPELLNSDKQGCLHISISHVRVASGRAGVAMQVQLAFWPESPQKVKHDR